LNGDQSCIESLRDTLENKRNLMMKMLNDLDGVKVTKPDGTFYCFADFSTFNKNSNKLSEHLIDKAQVLTVPGTGFGMDGYLRLSYCGTEQDITEGINRIRWALDPNSPAEIIIGDKKYTRDWV